MKQARVIELLQEMAAGTADRKNHIIVEFLRELPKDTPGEGDAPPEREDLHHDTMSALLTALFYRTPKERLVSLAPFVTLMCGEREPEVWTANIDWESIPKS